MLFLVGDNGRRPGNHGNFTLCPRGFATKIVRRGFHRQPGLTIAKLRNIPGSNLKCPLFVGDMASPQNASRRTAGLSNKVAIAVLLDPGVDAADPMRTTDLKSDRSGDAYRRQGRRKTYCRRRRKDEQPNGRKCKNEDEEEDKRSHDIVSIPCWLMPANM